MGTRGASRRSRCGHHVAVGIAIFNRLNSGESIFDVLESMEALAEQSAAETSSAIGVAIPKTGIVFINASGDTFTPTKSGSLGPWIWEICNAAQRDGCEPLVVSKNQPAAAPFAWQRTRLVEWPRIPKSRPATLLLRANRKVFGWSQFGLGVFARRVARSIQRAGASGLPMFLQNDPEMAVYFRRRFPRAKIICHFQNQQECWPRFRRAIKRAALIVTACSAFTARWIEQYYGLDPGSVVPIHSGVDAARFSPAPIEPAVPPIINFTGRTGIEKGPDLLLKAALKVSERTRNFSVQILGSSVSGWSVWNDFQGQLKQLITELESRGVAVRWPGHVDRFHIVDEMRRAHIHVMASRWDEPFGLVTLEGMACGLATVASRTGGTPEVVGDGGLLFERESVDELAEHLGRLVTDDGFRREVARRGRERAARFTWAKTWSQIKSIAGA